MSAAASDPAQSPLPASLPSPRQPVEGRPSPERDSDFDAGFSYRPNPKPTFPTPKLRLKCQDICHAGSQQFFRTTNPADCLPDAVHTVLKSLYHPSRTNRVIPPTRSVTLVLRSMGGVAYTTGKSLDDDHKEIHFSLDYVNAVHSGTPERVGPEIIGVLVHEMVHAWQWNGKGQAPVGLIEGIADFVRLKAGLGPPHWKQEKPDNWDAGYQHTAYFLEWLEDKIERACVQKINAALQDQKYSEESFWPQLFGKKVSELFEAYKTYLDGSQSKVKPAKLSMEDPAFWDLARQRKGAERTIVLETTWRTQRHLKRDYAEWQEGEVGRELGELWAYYSKDSDTAGSDGDNADADGVLVALDDAV